MKIRNPIEHRNLSHIKSLKDLQEEKVRLRKKIKASGQDAELLLEGLPGIAFQSGINLIVGKVAEHFADRPSKRGIFGDKSSTTKEKLKEAGTDTVIYGITRIIETLLTKK